MAAVTLGYRMGGCSIKRINSSLKTSKVLKIAVFRFLGEKFLEGKLGVHN